MSIIALSELIDAEVRRIIDHQHERARGILAARREVLDRIVRVLLDKEPSSAPSSRSSRAEGNIMSLNPLCCKRMALAALLTLPACSRREAEPAPDAFALPAAEALARARHVADTMTADLRTRVFAELQRAGPAAAMAVCADSAQAVTARYARAGVSVRRVSDRYRNPANRPDAYESDWLEQLDSLRAAGMLPVEVVDTVVDDRGRALRYLRPVLVAEPCLGCHGDRAGMQPAVLRLLDARYPQDRATGYRAGELRGAVSVRVPVQPE